MVCSENVCNFVDIIIINDFGKNMWIFRGKVGI